MERINPYSDHRLEITCRNDRLIIRKKPAYIVEQETVELYEDRVKPFLTRELIPKRPFAFHVRYYWVDKIDFVILNPEIDASWEVKVFITKDAEPVLGFKLRVKAFMLDIARKLLSQSGKNKKIKLFNLLKCPNCHSESFKNFNDAIKCDYCASVFIVKQGIPSML